MNIAHVINNEYCGTNINPSTKYSVLSIDKCTMGGPSLWCPERVGEFEVAVSSMAEFKYYRSQKGDSFINFDVLVTDAIVRQGFFGGEYEDWTTLNYFRTNFPWMPVIVYNIQYSEELAEHAISEGATSFIAYGSLIIPELQRIILKYRSTNPDPYLKMNPAEIGELFNNTLEKIRSDFNISHTAINRTMTEIYKGKPHVLDLKMPFYDVYNIVHGPRLSKTDLKKIIARLCSSKK